MSWSPGAPTSGPALPPPQVALEHSPTAFSPYAFPPPPVLQQKQQQFPDQKLQHKALAFNADMLQKDGGLTPVFNASRLRAVNVSAARPSEGGGILRGMALSKCKCHCRQSVSQPLHRGACLCLRILDQMSPAAGLSA